MGVFDELALDKQAGIYGQYSGKARTQLSSSAGILRLFFPLEHD